MCCTSVQYTLWLHNLYHSICDVLRNKTCTLRQIYKAKICHEYKLSQIRNKLLHILAERHRTFCEELINNFLKPSESG